MSNKKKNIAFNAAAYKKRVIDRMNMPYISLNIGKANKNHAQNYVEENISLMKSTIRQALNARLSEGTLDAQKGFQNQQMIYANRVLKSIIGKNGSINENDAQKIKNKLSEMFAVSNAENYSKSFMAAIAQELTDIQNRRLVNENNINIKEEINNQLMGEYKSNVIKLLNELKTTGKWNSSVASQLDNNINEVVSFIRENVNGTVVANEVLEHHKNLVEGLNKNLKELKGKNIEMSAQSRIQSNLLTPINESLLDRGFKNALGKFIKSIEPAKAVGTNSDYKDVIKFNDGVAVEKQVKRTGKVDSKQKVELDFGKAFGKVLSEFGINEKNTTYNFTFDFSVKDYASNFSAKGKNKKKVEKYDLGSGGDVTTAILKTASSLFSAGANDKITRAFFNIIINRDALNKSENGAEAVSIAQKAILLNQFYTIAAANNIHINKNGGNSSTGQSALFIRANDTFYPLSAVYLSMIKNYEGESSTNMKNSKSPVVLSLPVYKGFYSKTGGVRKGLDVFSGVAFSLTEFQKLKISASFMPSKFKL